MTDNQDRISQLLENLETLIKRQENFSREVNELREEINRLKTTETKQTTEKVEIKHDRPVTNTDFEIKKEKVTGTYRAPQQQTIEESPKYSSQKVSKPPKFKYNLEKFIGENLINKIGIAITVIGVAIGAKYSIEHELISPLTRIILG